MPSLIRHYINGQFVETEKRFQNINPLNGRLVSEVCEASQAEVDAAVKAARAAMDGSWGRMPVAERAQWMHRIADGIEARFEEFVAAEVADTGRPVKQARTLDVPRGIANFRFFGD